MTTTKDNALPTISERHMAIAESLGGGSLTLTCRGNWGIAPFYLTFGGRPVTGIATFYENGSVIEKWVHNDKRSARNWLIHAGSSAELADVLLADLADRMDEVIS